ncbi:MAG TPA: carbohydrate porin [Luteibacter sp.]|jgi:porin|nr:carbohydrate porin [Luteibacter sp.]
MIRIAPGTTLCFALVAVLATTPVAAQGAAPSDDAASATSPVATPSDAATTKPTSKPASGPLSPLAKKLEDKGIFLRSALVDQYADNPIGGVAQGHTNVGQFNIGADIDLDKAWGLTGGSFHFTVYRDYGQSLNHNVTGTFTKQQYIYKNEFTFWHLGLFAYEQKLFDDRLDVFVGRLGSTTYYGHLQTNCQFQSGSVCGEPRIIVSQAGLSLLPSATWGTNASYKLTPHTYLEAGVFEVNPTTSSSNGLDFSTAASTGITVPVEWGWTQTNPETTRYTFELKVGGYVSTSPLSDPYFNTAGRSRALFGGKAQTVNSSRDGVYVMGDRVVWRPDPNGSESINLFGGIVQQLDEAEIMHQQIYSGLVWTGPFSERPRDTIGFSASYFELTPREVEYLRDARIKAGGTGTNNKRQMAYELNYNLHLTRGLDLMPNVQYIVHPDNSAIPNTRVLPKNLLVYGLNLRVDIGSLLGFSRAPAGD